MVMPCASTGEMRRISALMKLAYFSRTRSPDILKRVLRSTTARASRFNWATRAMIFGFLMSREARFFREPFVEALNVPTRRTAS